MISLTEFLQNDRFKSDVLTLARKVFEKMPRPDNQRETHGIGEKSAEEVPDLLLGLHDVRVRVRGGSKERGW
jgi:hypothetical protein